MATPTGSRCRRRLAAATVAALAAVGALSMAAPAGAAAHTCASLHIDYTMWLNNYLTATNPKKKELAKDYWIEDFRLGKAMGCTWATGVPMSPS